MAFQFKIQIKGITKPPVWRRVVVSEDFTFLKFHNVIQRVFGWGNYHLFEFVDREYEGNLRIAVPSEYDLEYSVKTQNASRTKLSKIVADNSKLLYIYDFGDHWVHEITLEAITDDKLKNAICLAGKGKCPPEDCGGVYGYEEIKKIFQTMPQSEEANEYREWLGLGENENWDAHEFNLNDVENIRY